MWQNRSTLFSLDTAYDSARLLLYREEAKNSQSKYQKQILADGVLKPRKWSEKEWKRRWPNSIERYSAIHKNVYKELDPTAQEYFEKTLAFMNEQGKTPVIVLTPVNPKLRKILGPLGWDDRHDGGRRLRGVAAGRVRLRLHRHDRPERVRLRQEGVVRRRAHDHRQHADGDRLHPQEDRRRAAGQDAGERSSRPGGVLLNSYTFLLVFLPVVVVLYWLVPRGYPRMLFLIAASLVFYGLWDWRYIPLLLATTLVDWVAGHYLAKSEAEGASRRRKLILAAAVTINLAFLGYFKYRGFFVDSARRHPAAARRPASRCRRSSCCCRSASASTPSPASRTRWTCSAASTSRPRA